MAFLLHSFMLQLVSLALFYALILVISVGPITFNLVETSINKGFRVALFFILGVYFSDVLLISLLNLGFRKIFTQYLSATNLSLFGGFILIGLGVLNLLQLQKKTTPIAVALNSKTISTQFIKGFTLNTFAPSVVGFWIVLSSTLHAQKILTKPYYIYIFFGILLGLNFSFDIVKSLLAKRFKKYLTIENQLLLRKAIAVLFIAFGLYLLAKLAMEYL